MQHISVVFSHQVHASVMATLRRKQLSAGHLWKKSSMHSYLVAGLTERGLGPYSNRPWCLTGKQEMTSSTQWWSWQQLCQQSDGGAFSGSETKARHWRQLSMDNREGNGTPLQAPVRGVAGSRARMSDFTFTFHFHALEKEMAPHSSVLAWRIPGMEEPSGLPSVGSHRVGHDWSDLASAASMDKHLKEFC